MFTLNDKEIAVRLKEVQLDKRIKSDRAYALSINADPSFFAKILKGKKSITETYVKEMAKKWLVSEDWLLYGRGPKYGAIVPHETAGGEHLDLRDELIKSLKRENESLKRESERLDRDLKISLGELRHNALLARSVSETNQQLLIELLVKQRRSDPTSVRLEVNKVNGENYKRMKGEGKFADADR